jgi:exopolysaccharide biosynthesis polyprenyl glycosylphosphotransferase
LLGCVDSARGAAKRLKGVTVFENFGEALKVLPKRRPLDDIIQADSALSQEEILEAVNWATNHHISYSFVPNQFGLYASNAAVGSMAGLPMIEIRLTPLEGWGRIAKRIFDVMGATTAIIILSPLLLILAVAVKLSDPSAPALYRHRRLTRNGKEIYIYKFRSMLWKYSPGPNRPYKTTEEALNAIGGKELLEEFNRDMKVANDPRVTPLGKLLRKTSLDELPQLFNVLNGDMSMVGPRPIIPAELERYGSHGASFLSLKPGATGLWVVSGRNDISYEDRVKLDIYYVEHWSLMLDIKILIKTALTIFGGRGAY